MKASIKKYPDGRYAIDLEAETEKEQLYLGEFEHQGITNDPDPKTVLFAGYGRVRFSGAHVIDLMQLKKLTIESPFKR